MVFQPARACAHAQCASSVRTARPWQPTSAEVSSSCILCFLLTVLRPRPFPFWSDREMEGRPQTALMFSGVGRSPQGGRDACWASPEQAAHTSRVLSLLAGRGNPALPPSFLCPGACGASQQDRHCAVGCLRRALKIEPLTQASCFLQGACSWASAVSPSGSLNGPAPACLHDYVFERKHICDRGIKRQQLEVSACVSVDLPSWGGGGGG